MRIGLIADIHANAYGLEAVLSAMNGVDIILCAGDITGYYPLVNEVFDLIEEHAVEFILGNHDSYLLNPDFAHANPVICESVQYMREEIRPEFLSLLKNAVQTMDVRLEGTHLKICHGSPWNSLEGYVYPDFGDFERFSSVEAQVIVLGHTHHKMLVEASGRTIVNPGSCGQPRDNRLRPSGAILDLITDEVQFVEATYDPRILRAEVEHRVRPGNLLNYLLSSLESSNQGGNGS